jgi:tight adherence protein B
VIASDRSPPIERVAAVTERLAVLLLAGVPPAAAWGYLAAARVSEGVTGDPDHEALPSRRWLQPSARLRRGSTGRGTSVPDPAFVRRVLRAAASSARDGTDIAAAIADSVRSEPRRAGFRHGQEEAAGAWLAVAAAWAVAVETGAPLAGCLHQLARAQRALGQAQRDIDAALAGPRSTARLVMGLPLIGLLFGLLLGFDTLGTLLGTVPGLVCLTTATVLMLAAWRWSSVMVRRATPQSSAPGLAIDLTAIAMTSGASVDRAVAAVRSALARFDPGGPRTRQRPSSRMRAGRDEEDAAIAGVLALSRAAGAPAADLLRGEADQMRRDARSNAQHAAASLATRLMLPLGLCVLPAFMLVGVAPLLLSVLSSTVRGIG